MAINQYFLTLSVCFRNCYTIKTIKAIQVKIYFKIQSILSPKVFIGYCSTTNNHNNRYIKQVKANFAVIPHLSSMDNPYTWILIHIKHHYIFRWGTHLYMSLLPSFLPFVLFGRIFSLKTKLYLQNLLLSKYIVG